MTHDDFIALLDQTNPRYESLRNLIVRMPDHWCFARKGNDLVEVVAQFRKNNLEPVIDKRLRVVIGSFAHRAIRAELYRYHKLITGLEEWPLCREADTEHADSYTHGGMGYHFSSVSAIAGLYGRRVRPIVGENYRPDRFDKDLFLFYEVNTL